MEENSYVKPLVGVSIVLGTLVFLKKVFRRKWSCQHKTILITGASSGIGAALARYYAQRGANLLIVARRRENLEQVKMECTKLGAPSVKMVVADVATEEGWSTIGKSVNQQPLDLLCLNAGLSMGSNFSELSSKNEALPIMKRLMDVNYMGSVGPLDACFPQMLKSAGGVRIIVVSSVIGLVATPSRTGYAASKFALKGFFDSLRCELCGEGTKNTITLAYPGAVRTEINASRLAGTGAAAALSMEKALTADECASIMAEGHAQGERDIYYSMDGTLVGMVKSKLISYLAFFTPNIADSLIIMTMKQMTKTK